jgi:hypothetical protein
MPHGATDQTNDSPGAELDSANGDVNDTFAATMYLLWTPGANPQCNSSGTPCVIPVPLSLVNWRFKGDAINTLDPSNTPEGWILGCRQTQGLADQSQTTTSHPTWTTVTHNIHSTQ